MANATATTAANKTIKPFRMIPLLRDEFLILSLVQQAKHSVHSIQFPPSTTTSSRYRLIFFPCSALSALIMPEH
jgi:hypothetical protein